MPVKLIILSISLILLCIILFLNIFIDFSIFKIITFVVTSVAIVVLYPKFDKALQAW